jgi:hypothetical protein
MKFCHTDGKTFFAPTKFFLATRRSSTQSTTLNEIVQSFFVDVVNSRRVTEKISFVARKVLPSNNDKLSGEKNFPPVKKNSHNIFAMLRKQKILPAEFFRAAVIFSCRRNFFARVHKSFYVPGSFSSAVCNFLLHTVESYAHPPTILNTIDSVARIRAIVFCRCR